MCIADVTVLPLIHKSKSFTQIFQNLFSLHAGKEIVAEGRAGEGGIQVKAGNYQPNSLFPPKLCIGHLGVSLEEKQSPTKGCLK